jgi:hypothetical protein
MNKHAEPAVYMARLQPSDGMPGDRTLKKGVLSKPCNEVQGDENRNPPAVVSSRVTPARTIGTEPNLRRKSTMGGGEATNSGSKVARARTQ